jgi:hypothetical protein
MVSAPVYRRRRRAVRRRTRTEGCAVLSTGLQDPAPIPDSAIPAAGRTAPGAIDAEDPEVVPGVLTAFVAAARQAHAVMR